MGERRLTGDLDDAAVGAIAAQQRAMAVRLKVNSALGWGAIAAKVEKKYGHPYSFNDAKRDVIAALNSEIEPDEIAAYRQIMRDRLETIYAEAMELVKNGSPEDAARGLKLATSAVAQTSLLLGLNAPLRVQVEHEVKVQIRALVELLQVRLDEDTFLKVAEVVETSEMGSIQTRGGYMDPAYRAQEEYAHKLKEQ